jgi:hypothetical protein
VDFGVSGVYGPRRGKVANRAAENGEYAFVERDPPVGRARAQVFPVQGGLGPVEALRLAQVDGVWNLSEVSACLTRESGETACGSVVRFDGAAYELVEATTPDATDIGVGGIVGQASIPDCSTIGIPDGSGLHFKRTVFPATAYSSHEMDPAEELTMFINGKVRLLRAMATG